MGIAVSDVHQAKHKLGFGGKLLAYGLGGTVAGTVAGALLGFAGQFLPADLRAALATLAALTGIFIGIVELTGRRVPIPQADRETPFAWLDAGALFWSIRNGAALGFGARSRLGFWLWYVIPLGAFLSGSILIGAVGYGLYAATRTFAAGVIYAMEKQDEGSATALLRLNPRARLATAGTLVVMGFVTLSAVG